MTILHIDTSISGESRVSRTISKSVVDQFKAVMPGARVTYRTKCGVSLRRWRRQLGGPRRLARAPFN